MRYLGVTIFLPVDDVVSNFERNPSKVDVMELFGGEAGVIRLCLKRGLSSGGNVDLKTQWNLLDDRHFEAFIKLHDKLRPAVVIMAPRPLHGVVPAAAPVCAHPS